MALWNATVAVAIIKARRRGDNEFAQFLKTLLF